MNDKHYRRQKRKLHVRKNLAGTAERPRVSVYRSNQHIYAQVINDETGVTLAALSDKGLKTQGKNKDIATEVGAKLGEILKKQGVDKLVFDRNGYRYHGKIAALADGIRSVGINF